MRTLLRESHQNVTYTFTGHLRNVRLSCGSCWPPWPKLGQLFVIAQSFYEPFCLCRWLSGAALQQLLEDVLLTIKNSWTCKTLLNTVYLKFISFYDIKLLELTMSLSRFRLCKTLEILSVCQFLPHPLNALPDVLPKLHPFHVHCVLQDVWAFLRDHVPSPVEFQGIDKTAKDLQGPLIRDFGEDDCHTTDDSPTAVSNTAATGVEDLTAATKTTGGSGGSLYRAYFERLRLILIHMHLHETSDEFRRFFVDSSARKEQDLQMAMEY